MTMITRVGEPPLPQVGDVWFDPTTLLTQVYQGLNGPGGFHASPWNPILPSLTIPHNPLRGYVYIDPISMIPGYWDGQQWITAVPANYNFPPRNPPNGTQWTEQLTQTVYVYLSSKWMAVAVQPPGHTSNQAVAASPQYQFTTAPSPQPVISVPGSSSNISILDPNGNVLVSIDTTNGQITYGQGYTPDAAAQIFWRALTGSSPRFLQTQINDLVKDLKDVSSRLAVAEGQVLKFTQMGYKIPEPPKPFDPMDAWNRAMGIIK